MVKMWWSVILAALLLPIVVTASYPSHTMSDLLNSSTINGKQGVGELLFVTAPFAPQVHEFGIIANQSFQRYDAMIWSGSQSVKIMPPVGSETILVYGSTYNFQYQGNYIIQSNLNASIFAMIVVAQEDQNNISISILKQPTGFNISTSKKSFILGDEAIITFTMDVDDDVLPETYKYSYAVKTKKEEKVFNKTIVVKENINWTFDEFNLTNKTVKTGISEYFGYVVLENTGNKDVEIVLSKRGVDSYLIGIPQPQTLYRKSSLRLNFQLQVPTIQNPTDYLINLTFTGGNVVRTIPLNITVEDSLLPTIENITFSTDKVFFPNHIVVIATDNNEVKNVTMKFDNTVYKFKKDNQKFVYDYNFTKLSRYVIEFCAYDDADNKKCNTINKTFSKLYIFNDTLLTPTLPSKKIGTYSSVRIFTLKQSIPEQVTVELLDFSKIGGGTTNGTLVRIVDNDGSVKPFTQYENTIKVNDVGNVKLEIRSDTIGDYEGILRFYVPDYVEGLEDISFKVSFKDYDIPEDFSVPWFYDRDVTCNVKDTGDLDSSYIRCTMDFPIDTKKNDLAFPTTAREKEILDTEVGSVEADWQQTKRRSALFVTLLISMILIIVAWTYYMVYLFPYHRFMAKLKDD